MLIGHLDACIKSTPNESERLFLAAFSSIIMQLMQKYDKSHKSVGIANLHRWPADSNAVGFLSAVAAGESMVSLKKVRASSAARNSC